MTVQGKPDRCPGCGSGERTLRLCCDDARPDDPNDWEPHEPCYPEAICDNDWHSSPVPAAAPQAESVPSGKEWMYGWLNKRPKNPTFSPSQLEVMETMLQDATASLAAELAGSREGHRITGDCLKESLERVAELERSNSLLRERITAAEGLLRDFRDCYEFGDYVDSRIDDYFKENQ